MRSYWIFLCILLFTDGCVDPLSVPNLAAENALVVDASLTDQPGPHRVRIYKALSASVNVSQRSYIRGAVVRIRDDQGQETVLTENADGTYQTDSSFQGFIGRTYQLFITLDDNRTYESSAVLLEPAGELDKLYFEFEANSINRNDLSKPQDAFVVYLDAHGTSGASNLMRWTWMGTYSYAAFPELFKTGIGAPSPLPCSGFVAGADGLTQVGPCECCACWAPYYNSNVLLSDEDFVREATFNKVRIAQIPVTVSMFQEKLYLEVTQSSISPDVYEFWKLVRGQQQSVSDIFQPVVVNMRGTLRCTSDPGETVYGIFAASAVVRKSMFIYRTDAIRGLPPIDSVAWDCREMYPGATNERPSFW